MKRTENRTNDNDGYVHCVIGQNIVLRRTHRPTLCLWHYVCCLQWSITSPMQSSVTRYWRSSTLLYTCTACR